jgi:hypothetical protein
LVTCQVQFCVGLEHLAGFLQSLWQRSKDAICSDQCTRHWKLQANFLDCPAQAIDAFKAAAAVATAANGVDEAGSLAQALYSLIALDPAAYGPKALC